METDQAILGEVTATTPESELKKKDTLLKEEVVELREEKEQTEQKSESKPEAEKTEEKPERPEGKEKMEDKPEEGKEKKAEQALPPLTAVEEAEALQRSAPVKQKIEPIPEVEIAVLSVERSLLPVPEATVERAPIMKARKVRAPRRELTQEEKTCPICLEEGDWLCTNRHQMHKQCVGAYISHAISEAKLKYGCPYPGCTRVFSETEVRDLVDPESFEKYQYFKTMKSQPNSVQCPNCKHWTTGNASKPDLICPNKECNFEFCFTHSTAHPGVKCADSGLKESLGSRVWLKTWEFFNTHSCPNCKVPIQKNGGCPNMICAKCGSKFCWWCRTTTTGSCSHIRVYVATAPITVPLALAVGAAALPFVAVGSAYYYGRKRYRRYKREQERARRNRPAVPKKANDIL